MNLLQRREIREMVNECVNNVIQTLEENRYYPSIREAGTAATESAIDQSQDYIVAVIAEITKKYGLSANIEKVFQPLSFNDILPLISAENHGDFDELTE
ncbi:MAG: hypothetical protein V4563_17790, partial [Pseudomonadota bacterium]